MTTIRHQLNVDGSAYVCPSTDLETQVVWTDHSRPKSLNACEHCTGDVKTISGMLAELEAKRAETEMKT